MKVRLCLTCFDKKWVFSQRMPEQNAMLTISSCCSVVNGAKIAEEYGTDLADDEEIYGLVPHLSANFGMLFSLFTAVLSILISLSGDSELLEKCRRYVEKDFRDMLNEYVTKPPDPDNYRSHSNFVQDRKILVYEMEEVRLSRSKIFLSFLTRRWLTEKIGEQLKADAKTCNVHVSHMDVKKLAMERRKTE